MSSYDKNDIRQAFQVLDRRIQPKTQKSKDVGPGSYNIPSTLFNKAQVVPKIFSRTKRYIDQVVNDNQSVPPNQYSIQKIKSVPMTINNLDRSDKLYMKQFGVSNDISPGCQTYNVKNINRRYPSWRLYQSDKVQKDKVQYDIFRGPGCHDHWETGFNFITK
ncbi:hypothetical protein SS50377_20232 [Spironucleus salmonicida]|uniref:Uncharacterized protein n=1 Tax=Spironucleus salmonicida TaxID=348837 RepID=V6LM44_9EUKA|nr:hypothetical protein SS50377_20232 [Spironucleus salmonicida]|eukprot:EST45288.1 Hypothetical protein SS50377_14865 [Spironucleus salmonicida]